MFPDEYTKDESVNTLSAEILRILSNSVRARPTKDKENAKGLFEYVFPFSYGLTR